MTEKDEENAKRIKKLPVMEIFGPTIQGEGFLCGVRTSFIRFGLCDYRCTMCDSLHAVDPARVKANAEYLEPEAISKRIYETHGGESGPNSEWITFSGGNPCIHDLTELVYYIRGLDLLGHRIKIAVETQGTLNPKWLHMCDVITCSPKSPGMGEQFELDKFSAFVQEHHKNPGFNIKVVVFSARDLEWAVSINEIVVEWGLADRMYLSLGNPYPPGMDDGVTDDELKLELLKSYRIIAEDLLQMPHMYNVKFFPQLHVLAWSNLQGV